MPRTAAFTPKKTPAGWQLDIPAKHSETGARRKLVFKSERLAKAEAAKRMRQMRQHGARAVHIDADLASQAIKAAKLLADYDATLLQVVNDWIARRDEQDASVTLREAWEWSIEKRKSKGRSPLTIKDFVNVQKWMPDELLDKLVCDLSKRDIETALAGAKTASAFNKGRKHLDTVINDAIKAEWASANPVSKIETKDTKSRAVHIVTPDQLRALFEACRDHRASGKYDRLNTLDCRACEVPIAFLAFAGIRPEELRRLDWTDVSLEMRNIRICAPKSKTRTLRNVSIEAVLAAWIETLPEGLRKAGRVVPPDWTNKRGLVFRKAGVPQIDKSDQDRLRHSYGSYYLSAFNDLPTLQSNMGHQHVTTYFTHYHHSMPKEKALKYWSIGPAEWEAQHLAIA